MTATWAARLWGLFRERVVDPRAGVAVLTSMNLLMMVLQCCFLLTERVWWWIYLNTYTLGLFTVALYPGAVRVLPGARFRIRRLWRRPSVRTSLPVRIPR